MAMFRCVLPSCVTQSHLTDVKYYIRIAPLSVKVLACLNRAFVALSRKGNRFEWPKAITVKNDSNLTESMSERASSGSQTVVHVPMVALKANPGGTPDDGN